MKKKLLGLAASLALGASMILTAAPAQAANCTAGGQGADTTPTTCDITFTANLQLAASITFSNVPSSSFGAVLPGVASSPKSIIYTLGSNGNTTNIVVTGSGADAAAFQFDKDNLGSWVAVSTLSPGTFGYTGAGQNGSKTDKVRTFPSTSYPAGNITATLTYAVTVT